MSDFLTGLQLGVRKSKIRMFSGGELQILVAASGIAASYFLRTLHARGLTILLVEQKECSVLTLTIMILVCRRKIGDQRSRKNADQKRTCLRGVFGFVSGPGLVEVKFQMEGDPSCEGKVEVK